MRKLNLFIFFPFCILCLFSCKQKYQENNSKIDANISKITKVTIHGHRGDRGNFPENSIPAFLSALKKGVQVVELDVAISKDHQVVVSHEPFMHHAYMLQPNGEIITKVDEKSFNLYTMTYDSIKKFDAGSKENLEFPEQINLETYKPLLSEVIDTLKGYSNTNMLPEIKYNIEIKSKPTEYGIYQPQPELFVDLVMQVIQDKNIESNVYLQSFDPQILEIIHKKYPTVKISYLVSNGNIEENLKKLSFQPDIYSPYYKLIQDKHIVEYIHQKGMKLIPWTVNNKQDIDNMKGLGVDGIITDYPERAL